MTDELENFEKIEALIKDRLDLKERYADLRILGEGGFGKVYLARDRKLEKPVAIKFLHSTVDLKAVVRFQQEARALSKLNHQYIVKVLDFQHHSETDDLFLVMEYVDGESVESMVKKGPVPLEDAITTAIQLCDALEHAHGQGVVHRDLKPSNIMIDVQGNARILDFGIAKLLTYADPFGTLTRANQPVGTPLYMSPEQIRGEDSDERTDMYGLGWLLYTMISGRVPFEREQIEQTFKDKLSDLPPPSLRLWIGETETAYALDKIVYKTLRSDPDDRYQSMAELREALSGLISDSVEVQQITAQSKLEQPRQSQLNSIAFAVGVVLFGLAAVSCLLWFLFDSNQPATTGTTAGSVADGAGTKTTPSKARAFPSSQEPSKNVSTEDLPPGFLRKSDKEYHDQRNFVFADQTVDDAALKQLDPSFKEVSLARNTRVTIEGLKTLAALPLISIDLEETDIDPEKLIVLAGMKHLKWIRLNRTAIDDKSIKMLAPLGKRLERLDLDRCKGFGNEGLKFIVATFPNLMKLQIGATSVTRDAVGELGKLHGLKQLWLTGINVRDKDIKKISHLDFELLDLGECRSISDETVDALMDHERLMLLQIIHCPKVTNGKIEEWQAHHPDAKVLWTNVDTTNELTGEGIYDEPAEIK